MFGDWLKRVRNFYYRDNNEKDTVFYGFLGTWEIVAIVAAVIVIFGVGKLGNVGGALGKSIREFRREKDRVDDDPQLNSKQTKEAESSQSETKSQEENKN